MIDSIRSFIISIFEQAASGIVANLFATIIIAVLGLGGGILIVEINPRFRAWAKDIIVALWKKRALILLAVLAIVLFAYGSLLRSVSVGSTDYSPTLKAIQDRGRLRCGINVSLRGMGALDQDLDDEDASARLKQVNEDDIPYYDLDPSNVHGLDIDFCRAVSVAIFGTEAGLDSWDAVYSSTNGRFEAVRDGYVDVLFRNTSWTNERDFNQEVDFGIPYFYDKLAILIDNKEGNIETGNGFGPLVDGRKVCVSKGTTTYENMLLLKENSVKDEISFDLKTERFDGEEIDSSRKAFDAFFGVRGECDAVASDQSQIVSTLFGVDGCDDCYPVYGDNSSEVTPVELLSPVLPEGDPVWRSLIDNVIYTTIRAEELGISQDAVINSTASGVSSQEFLRPKRSENYWKKLGIKNNEYPAVSVIEAVGNYGEIYTRNLDEIYSKYLDNVGESPDLLNSSLEVYLKDSRGPNRILRDGGVLISPPR